MTVKTPHFIKRGRYVLAGAMFALTVAAAGVVSLSRPNTAVAAACDPVNIVFCGLEGSSTGAAINSYQHFYNQGSSNGHNDLKAVFRWSGATDAKVAGMNTSNSKMGTMFRNGDIKVDGKVVGQDATVSARFGAGRPGFTHVEGDVWSRKTTTSLEHDTNPVLVHFNSAGDMDFAVMITCGNAVRATPVHNTPPPPPPQPKKALECVSLVGQNPGSDVKFAFTARATATNTTITKYVFDFGDGKSQTVTTSQNAASSLHTYVADGRTFTARATVFSNDFPNGKTSDACTFKVKTQAPPPPAKANLVCTSLTQTGNDLSFTFTAQAKATNTTITGYTFHFSDGTTQTVNTSFESAQLDHNFTERGKQFTVFVTVASKDMTTSQTPQCTVTFTTPKLNECKPGVPVGQPECSECKPGVPNGSEECNGVVAGVSTTTPPATLVNTGPGDTIAIVVATGLVGGLFHHLILRRKFQA